jgi:glycerol uptake facilitator-like aquaporin
MIAALLLVLAIAALGVLVRRRFAVSTAARRAAAGMAGALAGAILLAPTQERVYAATTGFDARGDLLASAVPAGGFLVAVLLSAVVVLTLPRVRGTMVRKGAAPLEFCAAHDRNHRS